MGDIYQDFYAGAQNCINTSFCLDGGSFDSSNVSLPRSLKIRVIANPEYWGFGTTGTNTLIEGWGSFTNARFDFFDGFEPDHAKLKDCDATVHGPYINEQRPDVAYRSVYDPEEGNKHYANGVEDGIVRGGAESYLLDRGGNTTDNRSCDTSDPAGVFKTNPAGYGTAPKILFNSAIYKNITGAWRINECSGCYTQHDGGNDLRNLDCSGAPKQHIQGDENFAELYDPFRNRCISDKFYDPYVGESGCNSDGVIAGQYAGTLTSVVRDVGVKPFLKYTFEYDGEAASGIFNGKPIGITATSGDGGALTFFDVQHGGGSTTAYAVGSFGTGDYSNLDGGSWTLFDSYDPNTCCGGAAYGVDPALMNLTNSPLYHIDIGRVFNNPKNKIYSNRIDRTYNGLTVEPEVPKGTFHTDRTYVAVNEDGNGLLVESGALYEVDLACQTGVWSATGDYIYKLDGGYSTESGVGAEALSTDSGFFPLFPKTLPYYGPFDVTDRFDYTERTDQYGNRQTNRNATCYTKQGSLSVYPDCLSQYTPYTNCDPKTKYHLNNVPRIALVYRGCDFDDICSFDDSGRPFTNSSEAGRGWLDGGVAAETHPTNMDQLRRGFAGQEIQMFINLGTARAAEIKREPCCCGDPPCPGTNPPEYVEIPSPVTFPCFPKFDLRPEEYGCQDPLYYFDIMSRLGLPTDPSGGCSIPYYDACAPIQPYTTYGYIRNLCGKETNSRRETIDSLASKLHTGDYNDLNPADDTIEPMYVEFEQDVPDCCSPSGFPVGSPECDPSMDLTAYGEGASGELEIDAAGGITYRVTAAGSGYVGGGNVLKLASGILSPEQTFNATFGPPDTGLLSFTSTPGGPVTSGDINLTNYPAGSIIPLTIVGGGIGAGASGGFTYDDCSSQDRVHYWGLTDFQGRLAYPYFRTKPNSTFICGKPAGDYVDYSDTGTILKNWPRDKVPFLVEIDHEEYCSTCSTTQMPTGNLQLLIESLDTSYLHGMSSPVHEEKFSVYGWTHNKFPGISTPPQYDAASDSWQEDFCKEGDGLVLQYGQPTVGDTCGCADGTRTLMVPRFLKGTKVPLAYTSSGSVSYDGEVNSYFAIGCRGFPWPLIDESDYPDADQEAFAKILPGNFTYMSASIGCVDTFGDPWSSEEFGLEGLGSIYGCGTQCATSFPSPNSAPNLNLDFFHVASDMRGIFEQFSDKAIHNNADFLKRGLDFYVAPRPVVLPSPTAPQITCGTGTRTFTSMASVNDPGSSPCEMIHETQPDSREDLLTFTYCENGNKGKIRAGINLTPCLGTRVKIYSCSWWKKGVYNRFHYNSDGKFGGFCDTAVWKIAPGPPDVLEQQNIEGCYHAGLNTSFGGTGISFSDNCFPDFSGSMLPQIAAVHAAYSGGNLKPWLEMRYECQRHDADRCCYNFIPENVGQYSPYPQIGEGPFRPDNGRPYAVNYDYKGCECHGAPGTGNEFMDIAYDVTWSQLTNPVDGTVTEGWYGDVQFPVGAPGNCDNHLDFYYYEVENLPGAGSFGPLPLSTPIALHYTDEDIPRREGGFETPEVEPFCAYSSGPNRFSSVGAELFEPYRPVRIVDGTPNLQPELCTGVSTSNEFYANCGWPYPFDTYGSGITERVNLNRKTTWPEIQTVHKVECLSNGYLLHVSREYFEHNRTWYHPAPCVGGSCPVPTLGLIDGGGVAYQYAPVGDACSEIYYPDCADPNGGAGADQKALPFVLPMMTPTDAVGPIYPDESSPCATGTEIFYKTDTDFVISKTTSDEHPSDCMYFPAISGEQFWSFYNLLYDSGVPDSKYLTDAGAGVYQQPPDPEADCNPEYPFDLVALEGWPQLGPVFSSISEMRNHPHSCIQDLPECGGMFWNNKEFFPRKTYLPNTRVTAFGALSICEQNAQLEAPSWHHGHTGKTKSGPGTWDRSPNKTELAGGRFVDACDSSAAVLADLGQDIDSDILHVPFLNEDGTKNSLLTLMGVIHPGFRSDVNEKTCLYPETGCLDFLAEHNDSTIRDINFTPDEYGYYLDKLVASGSDGCLFTPFKIMVDVECCPDRIGHKGTSDPTNLNYMAKIPSALCNAWDYDPPCNCEGQEGQLHSCLGVKEGALLPGLSCAAALHVQQVEETATCYFECVGTTGQLAELQQSGIWRFTDPATVDYLIDPTGGDPMDAMTPLFNEERMVSNTDDTGCPVFCEIHAQDTYSPPTGYYWHPASKQELNLYTFEGGTYHVEKDQEPAFMDVWNYNGTTYRFWNNQVNGGNGLGRDNCCTPSGTPGKLNSVQSYKFQLPTTENVDRDGCDCDWSFCYDLQTVIPFTGVTISAGFNDPAITIPVPQGSGIPIEELFASFDCAAANTRRAGFYPSAIKINITELP
jgi:hypothetical protein